MRAPLMHLGFLGLGAIGAPIAARRVALDVINATSGRGLVREDRIPLRVFT
jgi:3-hydroxyisobutyrate dehydrogenase-like beta-hydroxyacid dehydrogenase